MRTLVTGVKGQLGHDVMNELAKRGYEGVGVDVEKMDITDAAAVDSVIREAKNETALFTAQHGRQWMQRKTMKKCAEKSMLKVLRILQKYVRHLISR